ncbi:MAG: hypothetical protein ABIJ00_04480 [Candidatus Eisenbacteria bacterium]
MDDYSDCSPPDCPDHYWYFELRGGDWEYIGEWEGGTGSPLPGWYSEVKHARECHVSDECRPYCGLCSEDRSSTPRENKEAEEAALWFTGSLVAPEEVYSMPLGHFRDIRDEHGDQVPKLRTTPFRSARDNQILLVTVTEETMRRYEVGELSDLESLNALYGVTRIQALVGRRTLSLQFGGRYNPYRLAEIYESVACIEEGAPALIARSPSEMGNLIPWVTR